MFKPFSHVELGHSLGSIGSLFNEALEIAKLLDRKVSFEFNGVKVNLTKHSTLDNSYDKIMEAVRMEGKSCFCEGW